VSRISTISENVPQAYHRDSFISKEIKIKLDHHIMEQNKKLNDIMYELNEMRAKKINPILDDSLMGGATN